MRAPVICFFVGHTPLRPGPYAHLSEGEDRMAFAALEYCSACGGQYARALPESERFALPPKPPKLNLFAVLLKLAPKARLSELGTALWEQGHVVDMLETTPLEKPVGPSNHVIREGEQP